MWRNIEYLITSVKTAMILNCISSEKYFQRWNNGFSEKGWQELYFNFLWKIPHAFGSDTILCVCIHSHTHTHFLFVSVAAEFYVTFMWNEKLEGNI